jgi:protein-disulfide isomerase/peroxiredoxin|tara:strand:+ start:123 stop:2291 length:2169 start_codon:yes stop_codon:yes gene_type:complete
MKKCPFCAELVKVEAIVCKLSNVDGLAVPRWRNKIGCGLLCVRASIIAVCFFISNLFGQVIHGEFVGNIGGVTQLYLLEVYGGQLLPIDTTRVASDGSFSFSDQTYPLGYYRLAASPRNGIDLILNPEEEEVYLRFTSRDLESGVEVVASRENMVYRDYDSRLLEIHIEEHNVVGRLISHDSDDRQAIREEEKLLRELRREKRNLLNEIAKEYDGTFFLSTAEVDGPTNLGNLKRNRRDFFKSDFLSSTYFVGTSLIPAKLNEYLNVYTGQDEESLKASVDEIFYQALSDEEVYGLCLDFLLAYFDQRGPEEVFDYVMSEYLTDESLEGYLSGYTMERLEARRLLAAGSSVPDVRLMDTDGKWQSLSDRVSDCETTLLFFWSSQCPHCIAVLPQVKELYRKYGGDRFGVIGISLDKKKHEWVNGVREHNLPWVNLSDLRGWDSEAAAAYYVNRTPTFFLVNNEMQIEGRSRNFEDIARAVHKRTGKGAVGSALEEWADSEGNALSSDEEEAIEALVEEYLLNNPEIVSRTLTKMAERREAAAAEKRASAMKSLEKELKYNPSDPVGGNPDGALTIVEFFDYRCGYCKRMYRDLQDVVREDGDIRLVYKDLPVLGPSSRQAAMAALASVPQGKYEQFHGKLMEFNDQLTDDHILRLAGEVGLDVHRLKSDMENEDRQLHLRAIEEIAESLVVQGTPALIIGNRFIPGALTRRQLEAVIAEERR